MEQWGSWVRDCLRLMDGDGTFSHYPYPGSLYDQPAIDMKIFDIIRMKINEIKNKEMENKWHQKSK